jgi:3-hydroxyisobutyrate dehydrogenase-like beta-hydroxyacid dehydrogenase
MREIELMGFTWYEKDLDIAEELAAGVGRNLPVARLSRQLMKRITVASVRELLGLPRA